MQMMMVITKNNLENTKSEEVVKIVIKMLIMVGNKRMAADREEAGFYIHKGT